MNLFKEKLDHDQQTVMNRLPDIYHTPKKDNSQFGIKTSYMYVGIVIFILCFILLFKIIPNLITGIPFFNFHSYAFNFKNVCFLLLMCLGAGVGAPTYWYYKAHGGSRKKEVANDLTKHDLDDSRVDTPAEMVQKFDIVPDNKVHYKGVNVTALMGHQMYLNSPSVKGLDGNVRFDNKFGNELFDIANLPHDKQVRIFYNAAKMAYNPTHKYDKGDYKTVKDVINNTWYVPEVERAHDDQEETQDPTGIYIVSSKPENTIVVSETRGGKGIKYIEPILDVWSRAENAPNIVVTDLKMELVRMFLRTFTLRGYNVKTLNLMQPSQTDAINFIGYAVNAAIKGDMTQMEKEISSISSVFFVNTGNQDPMWNNAATANFKRIILGLIDYYNEKVNALKEDTSLSAESIIQKSDEEWGHVTLYEAYKFAIDASAKTYPRKVFEKIYPKDEDGNINDPDPSAEYKSGLTIYFDAIDVLPTNSIRAKIADQNKAVMSVASSEKTLASIYGVCLFGMIYFTDNTIIQLTSSRPSSNLDLEGLAFPRRLGVSFNKDYAERHSLIGSTTVWQPYHDPEMTKPYPEDDFRYEGNVDTFRWANAYFRGKFDDQPVYIKLTIYSRNGYKSKSPNNLKLAEFDFVFHKGYRKSQSGRQYLINPITGEREVQGGSLHEYTYDKRTNKVHRIRSGINIREHSLLFSDNGAIKTKTRSTIVSYDIHYSDKPVALFLVTSEPTYNKILLMTIDNLYEQQVAACKLAFSDQHPVVPTKWMMDEFGNIQSEGKGVANLDTKLDSGLTYGQQFTLILQSLSQIKTLYNSSIQNTILSNSSTFFFMKSKDKEMIHFLMNMNGKKHIAVTSSQSYTKGGEKVKFFGNPKEKSSKADINVTVSRQEVPLLSENDYLHLTNDPSDGNAIVSRGSSTEVDIRDGIMPVSYKLLANNLGKHGKEDGGTPAGLPTMVNNAGFSSLKAIPNTDEMIATVIEEAAIAPKVVAQFKKVEHKTDHDIATMDADVYSDRIMAGIRANLKYEKENQNNVDLDKIIMSGNDRDDDNNFNRKFDAQSEDAQVSYTNKALRHTDKDAQYALKHSQDLRKEILAKRAKMLNKEPDVLTQMQQTVHRTNRYDSILARQKELTKKRYANESISRFDLLNINDQPTGAYDDLMSIAFADCYPSFQQDPHFILEETAKGPVLKMADQELAIDVRTNDDGSPLDDSERFIIKPAFIKHLVSLDSWDDVAQGRFEQAFIAAKKRRDEGYKSNER